VKSSEDQQVDRVQASSDQAGSDMVNRNMRPTEAALYTGLSESTLAKLRMRHKRGEGPRYIKISGCIIYRRSDLDAWMNKHIIGSFDHE
jgi:predicted DNA-binding transcriptional regulator AlpA